MLQFINNETAFCAFCKGIIIWYKSFHLLFRNIFTFTSKYPYVKSARLSFNKAIITAPSYQDGGTGNV